MTGSSVPYFPQKPLYCTEKQEQEGGRNLKSHRLPPSPQLTPSETESQTHVWCGMGFQAYVQILTL